MTALHTPCHTQDSICWFLEDDATDERVVFTGDTLFIGGKCLIAGGRGDGGSGIIWNGYS